MLEDENDQVIGNLFFIHKTGEETLAKENILKEKVYKEMTSYVHQLNPDFKIPYVRTWFNESGDQIFDVGSHIEFFKFKEVKKNDGRYNDSQHL